MPLDPAGLQRLCKLGGNKFAVEMIDLFLGYGRKKVSEARLAMQANNLAAVAAAAHPVKSSAGNVGATRLQALAARTEQLAQEGKTADLPPLIGELEAAFVEVAALLEEKKAKLKPAVS